MVEVFLKSESHQVRRDSPVSTSVVGVTELLARLVFFPRIHPIARLASQSDYYTYDLGRFLSLLESVVYVWQWFNPCTRVISMFSKTLSERNCKLVVCMFEGIRVFFMLLVYVYHYCIWLKYLSSCCSCMLLWK